MIYNIPADQWIRIHDSTSDIVHAGTFSSDANALLKHIKVGFFKNNCNGLFRIRLHTSDNYSKSYAVSEWVDMADVESAITTGNIRFDFEKEVNIISGKTYHVTIEASSYTRTGDANYVGWVHDLPFPTNAGAGHYPVECALKMEFFGK